MTQSAAGSLDQILAMMAAIAASKAFATEVGSITENLSGEPWSHYILDANEQKIPVSIAESTGGMQSFDWVHTSFAKISTAESLALEGAFPRLVILGQPGQVDAASDQRDWKIMRYVVDTVVMTQRDNAINAEREALILADAYMNLLDRNNTLAALAYGIEPNGPPNPASAGQSRAHGVIGGALARYTVRALRQP